jgi:hypothetical protein
MFTNYVFASGGGGGGWRWWREEDPYWPMRDWGDHPMRWWTWGLAGMLAGEGLVGAAALWGLYMSKYFDQSVLSWIACLSKRS